ncbi:MAG: ComEC [candidate division CPR2 bacterium GW2011_GWC1_41_48]|uniref:ComEC n=1 Tax=candidate division CPR2 bacterium GW2011_GWC1_41_48 TaxID=1618344 RepID=A0A0G0W6K2_UNCC2|nr:MAG: ComEC [candidate division CPR2 bacterium GW2011_GWC2_39_35]KKR27740.1 MAG: ComEC [candidate division CPR2 bacterium GW2011_GWD2_39_7]KKR27872.1 MAG: ComEC [candidate division CPR2 bacterium GW2011_GWD1_39_7]KKS08585.1 MAG: ComEC [candidate division CPR2 bacterium GW2011_GWC1_41_48]OGB60058.1 MAG: hypothetical protein A2Y27_02150 [candidate division CPR2 bacterium GWD1_39_7]
MVSQARDNPYDKLKSLVRGLFLVFSYLYFPFACYTTLMKAKLFVFGMLNFAVGVATRTFFEIPFDYLLIVFGLVIGIFFIKKDRKIFALAMGLAGFIFGFFWLGFYELKTQPNINITNEVVAKVWDLEGSNQFQSQTYLVKPINSNFYVRTRTEKYPKYELGDTLRVSGVFKKNNDPRAQKDHIYYSVDYPKISYLEGFKKAKEYDYYLILKQKMVSLSFDLNTKIDQIYPEPYSSLASGVLLGGRSNFSKETLNKFSVVGIIHIVAVSGYNVVIIATILGHILKRAPRRFKFMAFAFGIWGFVLLTGASSSAVRAGAMASVLLLARFVGRDYYPLGSVLFASSVMIFSNPLILVYDLGFQLSFLAVVGIIYFYPLLSSFVKNKGLISETLLVTLSAQVLTMPLIAYKFGMISLVAPLANILILPVIPYLMATVAISVVGSFLLPSFGILVGFVGWVMMEYIFRTVDYLSKISWSSVQSSFTFWHMIIIYFIILDIRLMTLKHGKIKKEEDFLHSNSIAS